MISTYVRYREKSGQNIPFAPPLPSPKSTEELSPRQRLHWGLWRWGLPLWGAVGGHLYTTRRPLMLIGCHHSGTTILANLISQHPDLIEWSEAPEVWTPDDAFLNWSVLAHPPLPQPFLFDLESYRRTKEAHGQYIAHIRRAFTFFAVTRLKRRFLNKNPHLCISVPYIDAAFPDAFYIHIRRNGYAVVQSLLKSWRGALAAASQPENPWAKLHGAIDPVYFDDPLALVRLCARYWQQMDAEASAALANMPGRVYSTTYESICAEPEHILRQVFAQAGLDPNRYDWAQLRQPTRRPWNRMLPMENRNFKYRERLTPAEIDAITQEVGETLAAYGYLDHAD